MAITVTETATNFRWTIEINGINEFLVQELQMPETERPVFEIGQGADLPNTKWSGKKKIGEMTLKMLVPIDGEFKSKIEEWYDQGCADKKLVQIRLQDCENQDFTGWDLEGVFPNKISWDALVKATDGEAWMVDVTCQVERFIMV